MRARNPRSLPINGADISSVLLMETVSRSKRKRSVPSRPWVLLHAATVTSTHATLSSNSMTAVKLPSVLITDPSNCRRFRLHLRNFGSPSCSQKFFGIMEASEPESSCIDSGRPSINTVLMLLVLSFLVLAILKTASASMVALVSTSCAARNSDRHTAAK